MICARLTIFRIPVSFSYVGFQREVRPVDVTFVDKVSCFVAPLKEAVGMTFAVAIFEGSSGVMESIFLRCFLILLMSAVQL